MVMKPKTERADHFKWAAAAMSFGALIISGASYYNSIQSDERKEESLGLPPLATR
jgi:hypothetical protein